MRTFAGLLLLSALVVSGQDPQIGRGLNLYSIEKEKSLGAQLDADLVKTLPPLKDDVALAYVRYVGARLAAQLPQPLVFSYEFEITSQSDGPAPLEPVALPGGYIFVPTMLILAARDEAEFAGTLAHAMAHVAARHGTRTASRGEVAGVASAPLTSSGGLGAYGVRQTRNDLLPAGFLQFQRAFESEADLIAVNIAARAGYNPQGLENYIGRVQTDSNPPTLSSVPPRDSGIQAIQRTITALPQGNYTSSGDFARIQEEVRRLAPPAPAPAK